MNVRDAYQSINNFRLLAGLNLGIQDEPIRVRVTRVLDSASFRAPDELTTHFILLDEEDNQILALARPLERPRMLARLLEGMIYYINNFKIVVGPEKWRPVAGDKAILFGQQTTVSACYERCSIARLKFDLYPLTNIAAYSRESSILLDVAGVIIKVGDIKHCQNAVENLDIELMDASYSPVPISLWGSKTSQFETKFDISRKRNVAVVITGLRMKWINGNACLSPTPATKFYFNPAYKQIGDLGDIIASEYGEFVCRLPSTEIYDDLYPISVHKVYLNLKEVKDPANWLRPKLFKRQSFFCKVTITGILSCEEWGFRYLNVGTILSPQETVYHCDRCNLSFAPVEKRLQTIILEADSTSTARLVLNSHEVEQLTGLSMLQLLTSCTDKHATRVLPLRRGIECIKGTVCTFEVAEPDHAHAGPTTGLIIKSLVESSKLAGKRKSAPCLPQPDGKKAPLPKP